MIVTKIISPKNKVNAAALTSLISFFKIRGTKRRPNNIWYKYLSAKKLLGSESLISDVIMPPNRIKYRIVNPVVRKKIVKQVTKMLGRPNKIKPISYRDL